MTLLQRVSRNVLRCGSYPSSWMRKTGRRKTTKIIAAVVLFFLVSSNFFNSKSVHKRQSEDKINVKDNTRKEVQKIVEKYEVKEDPPSRHLMGLKNCSSSPPELKGALNINPNITPSFEDVMHASSPDLLPGGCYSLSSCKPLQKVAVIIPFKDRDAHLKTLLYYLHPMLQRQKIHYCIFVAEQFDNGQFNKAMIMNAAFEEAMKLDNFDCIVFHDVDMIPEDDRNLYMCGDQPRHLSPAIDKFEYKPHYGTDFGGVTGISPKQYRKANGHSNQFWGWGGEDNDMEFRIFFNEMKIEPSEMKYGRYKMIVHKHPWKFSPNELAGDALSKTKEARAKYDGLSDLTYRLVNIDKHREYTKFMIDIRRIEVKRVTLLIDGKPTMEIDVEPGPCRWERYDGKYLDFNIDLSKVEEAAHLKSLNSQSPRTYPPIPSHVKIVIPKPTQPKSSFTLVNDFNEAIDLCEKLYPECQGVQKENSDEKYSLRKSRLARNIVISAPFQKAVRLKNGIVQKNAGAGQTLKRYFFPHKTPFVKYCPGATGGHFQTLKGALKLDEKDVASKERVHSYSFIVHFSVLLKPADFLHYKDSKHFEAQLSKGQNYYTFGWPKGRSPDFSNPETPREYVFKTVDFTVPNIPGCYGVESRVQDRFNQPYFQWNWWFEVSTGDREMDAKARETYWKKLLTEEAAMKRLEMQKTEKLKKDAAQQKREHEFQKKMSQLHAKDLSIQEVHLKKKGIVIKKQKVASKFAGDNKNVDKGLNPAEETPKKKMLTSLGQGHIEPFDPEKTIPKVKANQFVPTVQIRPPVKKFYHAALPPHLRNQKKI